MSRLVVSYKVAQWLKQQGYDEAQVHFYNESKKVMEWHTSGGALMSYRNSELKPELVSAPTYMDAWIWLWKKKQVYVLPITQYKDGRMAGVSGIDPNRPHYTMLYPDPESAIASIIDDMVK